MKISRKSLFAMVAILATFSVISMAVILVDGSDADTNMSASDDTVNTSTAYTKTLTGPGLTIDGNYTLSGASWLSVSRIDASTLKVTGTSPSSSGTYNVTVTGGIAQWSDTGIWSWKITVQSGVTTYSVVVYDGASTILNTNVQSGQSVTLPVRNDTTEKTFKGYYTASSGGTKVANSGQSINVTQNYTLYAQWTDRVYYTVTFDYNGKVQMPNYPAQQPVIESYYQTIESGKSVTLPSSVSNIYTDVSNALNVSSKFTGWSLTPSGSVVGYSSTVVTSNMKFYAQFDAVSTGPQIINFNSNGGYNSPGVSSQEVMAGEPIVLPMDGFSRDGHYLSGWREGSTSGPLHSLGKSYIVGDSITFYAQWTLIPDNHVADAPSIGKVGQVYTYNPDFSGDWASWYQYSWMGAGVVNTSGLPSWLNFAYSDGKILITGTPETAGVYTVSLYVNGHSETSLSWFITVYPAGSTVTTYTVIYEGNGGVGWIPNRDNIRPNNVIILPPGGEFIREGYTQIYWIVNEGGIDVMYSLGSLFTVKENATVRAKWLADANIAVFNANGGVGTVDPFIVSTDGLVTLPSTGFTRDGYALRGWYLSYDSSTIYPLGHIYTISGSVTFYAYWVANGTSTLSVTINANGGTGGYTQQIESGKKVILPAYGINKPDSTLLGWATSSGATSPTHYGGDAVTITSATTFYAVWGAADDYVTISFNLNNGIGSIPAQTISKGSVATKPADPTRAAHIFNGWQISGGGPWEDWDTTISTDMTLVAQWILHFSVNSSGTVVTVSVNGQFAQEVMINWGDGTSDTIFAAQATHDYGEDWAGTITVNSTVNSIVHTSSLPYAVSSTSQNGQEPGGDDDNGGNGDDNGGNINWLFWALLAVAIIGALFALMIFWPALFVWVPVMAAVLWWVF